MVRTLRNLGALALLGATTLAGACSQTPVLVPLRSMERPKDVDFICLHQTADHYEGVPIEKCAQVLGNTPEFSGPAADTTAYHLHAVVTQVSRGELAVADLGYSPSDIDDTTLIKVDPRIPGYSFIPVGAVPTDVVADPDGQAVFVASGRTPRIDIIPAVLLRGPIDTTAEQGDQSPWPHITLDAAADGVASALTIVRTSAGRRLYVVLPEAKPAAKIAVYDLGATALAPSKVGDITLDAADAPALPWAGLACGTDAAGKRSPQPWWSADQLACTPGSMPPSFDGTTVAGPTTEMHLSGIAVVGTKIFASDDKASFIHVLDAESGKEEQRIAIGAPTSSLSVSPPVPDEVDIHTIRGVDICQENGWLGDGRDHSDNATVLETLGGRCNLHRYIYAVDIFNPIDGSGSIAIVDLPITYAVSAGGVVDRTRETIDFANAKLVQPLTCDSPGFPRTRIPYGINGVGGLNGVPARGVTFVTVDPPTANPFRDATGALKQTAVVPAARCRAWDRIKREASPGVAALLPHPDGPEFEGVAQTAADARRDAGEFWRGDVSLDPTNLRGTFAFVALQNGFVVIVDIDDYDGTCRGPRTTDDRQPDGRFIFGYPNEKAVAMGNSATGEYFPRVVARHRPRSRYFLDANAIPAVSAVTLARFGSAISNDPATETGKERPHFTPLSVPTGGSTIATAFALPSADNPYTLSNEVWTITYEGPLPGYGGNYGDIVSDGTNLTLIDNAGAFCLRGVEDVQTTEPVDRPEAHDSIQLVEDTCPDGVCFDGNKTVDECHTIFGDGTELPMKKARTLYIAKTFNEKLTLAPWHWTTNRDAMGVVSDVLREGYDSANLRSCFGIGAPTAPLHRYLVRSSESWVVFGSTAGYIHRRKIDPSSAERACTEDTARPKIYEGRVRKQLAPLAVPASSYTDAGIPDRCDQFVNPAWRFAIRAGTKPSQQDMQFSYSSRFNWTPFTLTAGTLPQSIDSVKAPGWNMIAVVDAVDNGLSMFSVQQPFNVLASKKLY